jgi:hypothetical protein
MNATALAPTFDTCLALKKAGLPQDTVLSWSAPDGRRRQPRVVPRGAMGPCEGVAAPTLAELLARLPADLAFAVPHPIFGSTDRRHSLQLNVGRYAVIGYHLVGSHDVQQRVESERAVEAAARLYLALCAAGRLASPASPREEGKAAGRLAWAA